MSEESKIYSGKSEEEKYQLLLAQIESLISGDDTILSNLCNITAALNDSFDKISWAGFYIIKNDKLRLGPFQGKVACTQIKIGAGVCGVAAQKGETIIVEDVHKFPGHIACDSGSNSEIVVPVFCDDKLFGVIDIDSYQFAAFNSTDKTYLEKLAGLISQKLNLSKFHI